jgi:hypothetical protein
MPTNSRLLTIVIPTRDRPGFLELCLRSIFECQTIIPEVIVSDNSTSDYPAVHAMRRKYGFAYVRQSGKMSMSEHVNTCISLPSTPWMMLLHDDDEVCPDSLSKVEAFLAKCEDDMAVIMGGLQYIDPHGKPYREWTPGTNGTYKAEEALLQLGLDFHGRSSNTAFHIVKSREIGGFPDIDGMSADYTFFCLLAFYYGIRFLPDMVGRYRTGHEQATNVTTPDNTEWHLRYCVQMAKLVRSTGCSPIVADQLVDQMTWGLFLAHAARWRDSQPAFVFHLCQQCLFMSPPSGAMQIAARMEYPVFFWRPQWLARLLFLQIHRFGYVLKRRQPAAGTVGTVLRPVSSMQDGKHISRADRH